MYRNVGYNNGGSMNNIIKYCNQKQCVSGNNTPYLKVVTAGNNPTITKATQCSTNIKNSRRHNCSIVPSI